MTSEEFYDHGTCRYNGIIHGGSVYVPKTIFGRVGRNCRIHMGRMGHRRYRWFAELATAGIPIEGAALSFDAV